MRHKQSVIALLAAGYIVLIAFSGWAAQPSVSAERPVSARGVARYIMGYNAELQGAVDEAASYYEDALKEDASSDVVRMRLASAYAQLNRFSDAARLAEEVVRHDPQGLSAHYFLGLLYSQQKLADKASSEYEFILKSLAAGNPASSEFPVALGQLYYAQGEEQKAMEQFATALKLDPKNTSFLYILGTYYLDGPRRKEGVDMIKQCLALEPKNAECLNSLAYSYAEDNIELDKALDDVNAALSLEPKNAAYLDTRGWVYYRKGLYENALKELLLADALVKDPTILEHIAEVYQKLGKTAEALKYQQEKEQTIHAQDKKIR
ncbi:MAG: tetratricopeptide repeat protein [Candidatus Omnitrophica bacterium]|nr:tetratricopeptide repeat protein [Candidatus Omnitrophota bacterium]